MTDKDIARHLECVGCPHTQALLRHVLATPDNQRPDINVPQTEKTKAKSSKSKV